MRGVGVGLVLVLAACGPGTPAEETRLPSSQASSASTTVPSPLVETAATCGGQFPVFLPSAPEVEGTPGVGSQASGLLDGQIARHWVLDQTVYVDARWPYGAGPEPGPRPFTVIESRQVGDGVVMVIDIGGPPGCDLMRVEVHSDGRAEHTLDVAAAFPGDVRPIDQLEAYLNPPAVEVVREEADPAIRVVEQFLEAAGAGEYQFASGALFNEGVSPTVEAKLGLTLDNWDSAAELLADYCSEALCNAPYTILGVARTGPEVEAVVVEFLSDDGPVDWRVPVGQFEGVLTLGDVPPVGSAVERPSLSMRLFGSEEVFTATWYDTVQLIGPDSGRWVRWWTARYGQPTVLGRWGLTDYVDTLSIEDLAGEFETERIPTRGSKLAGAGTFADREVTFLSSGDELLEVDLATLDVEPLLMRSDPAGSVGTAAAAGATMAVVMRGGDSTWVEFYDRSLDLVSSTRDSGIHTSVALDPTGTVAAVGVATEGQTTGGVALIEVATGEELAKWSIDGSGTLTGIAFNGEFVVATVSDSADGGQLPSLFVVDTSTGATRVVSTSARVGF